MKNLHSMSHSSVWPGDPHFGAELDYPLFYVCPVLELSETPIIPVYNFEIVSGPNSRRHNFYILSDLLKALDMNETELRQHCSEIFALELTVGEVIKNLKHPYYNGHVTLPASISSCSKSTKVKFLPLCSKLRNLLDIKVVSLDDWFSSSLFELDACWFQYSSHEVVMYAKLTSLYNIVIIKSLPVVHLKLITLLYPYVHTCISKIFLSESCLGTYFLCFRLISNYFVNFK